MEYSFELNNAVNDATRASGNIKANSPVVEVFSAMVEGKELNKFGKVGDRASKYIMELNEKASMGDYTAIAELNTIRRIVLDPHVAEEAKLLGVFGSYKNVGWNENVEIEYTKHVGVADAVNVQAEGTDVGTPTLEKARTGVDFITISGGHAVDYRKAQLGNMEDEYTLQEEVRKQIRNKSVYYVMKTIYDSLKNASGVKYIVEDAGLTKGNVDKILTSIRHFGKTSVAGDYALLTQFSAWAGYSDEARKIFGISEKTLDKLAEDGLLGVYNGTILKEMPNPYDITKLNADGTDFATVLPEGLGIVTPNGTASPVHTFTRGGLTTMTGTDVTTGKIVTRFDLSVGTKVEPTNEFKLGLIADTNLLKW